ncbi:MAG: toxin-antitoxin system YwqK family antitoxin [Pedobacter sp.]|nr:MAG: toxin-antitoxin system YwqK family antitoxin [Pedobacter sp.]
MAHQAQLRNKIFIVALVALAFGCRLKYNEGLTELPLFNSEQLSLTMNNGLAFSAGKPFSGRIFSFYQNTKDTAEIVGFLNGREHGEWKKFYPADKKKEVRYFKNGQKTGSYNAWWENGNKQLEYIFVDDEYEGTCKEWNEKGELSRIMNYSKGQEEGEQKWWYDGGKIKANYVIKDGRRYGLLGTKNCINVSDSVFKN